MRYLWENRQSGFRSGSDVPVLPTNKGPLGSVLVAVQNSSSFFTAEGAPNTTFCTAVSTDGFGGKGLVQAGNPITGSVNAVTTAKGGFNFPAAPESGTAGLRATGVVGEFGALYPYVYSYTYVTMRNARGSLAMPSAARVPSTVDRTTTAAATHRLSQVGRSQSALPK